MVKDGTVHTNIVDHSHFADIVSPFLAAYPDISFDNDSSNRRFGMSCGLKHKGKLIAFLAKGRMIVKLPNGRVEALAADGNGERCDMGRGRMMREWVAVGSDKQAAWPALLTEARAFAVGNGSSAAR
jgi:hypothetical protein